MADQKNKDLFALLGLLHEGYVQIEHYAIDRNKAGKRFSGRLDHIEKLAKDIEQVAIRIQKQTQSMRRK